MRKALAGEKFSTLTLGKSGEEIACDFLKKKKYRIIERNFRFQRGEIDLVAYDRDTLVFVEVKTRKSAAFGQPEESVTPRKQHQLRRIAQGFMAQNSLGEVFCRFDVVSISVEEGGRYSIKHIKNAF